MDLNWHNEELGAIAGLLVLSLGHAYLHCIVCNPAACFCSMPLGHRSVQRGRAELAVHAFCGMPTQRCVSQWATSYLITHRANLS